MSVMNALFNIIIHVSLLYQLIPQYHQPKALSPGGSEQKCRGILMSEMNGPYKTIFQVTLLYQLTEHSVPGDLNECAEASQMSPMNGLFKTIFGVQLQRLVELCFPADTLSPSRAEQTCRGFPMSVINALSRTSSK